MNLIKNLTVITLAAAMGYGCSSSSTPAPTPNGIYSGTITGGAGTPPNGDEKGIIYNGRFMVFSTVFDIQQLYDASLTITDSSFSALVNNHGNAFSKRFSADLSGTFVTNTSISATVTNVSGSNLTDATINLIADTALYNKGSNLATVTGGWQGTHGNTGNATSLIIDATGAITSGSDNDGCNFTGSVIPADTSFNVYNVTLVNTGGTGCSATKFPAGTYTGLAWTEGATDTTLNLTVADDTYSRSVILTKN